MPATEAVPPERQPAEKTISSAPAKNMDDDGTTGKPEAIPHNVTAKGSAVFSKKLLILAGLGCLGALSLLLLGGGAAAYLLLRSLDKKEVVATAVEAKGSDAAARTPDTSTDKDLAIKGPKETGKNDAAQPAPGGGQPDPPIPAKGAPGVKGGTATQAPTLPELGPARKIQPGVVFREVRLTRAGVPMKIWVYLPEKAPAKLPLVLVPPAGSTLMAGMELAEDDRPEHFPYVKAGFAVVSFEIDGNVPRNAPDAVILQGAGQFKNAQAGIANARAALDYALAKVPAIDANRIYIAGHSSAATLSLLYAAHEPRIKGCIAYAAVTDVEDRLAPVLANVDNAIPGYRDFIRFSSPMTHVDKLKCPVFLFYAQDDTVVPPLHSTDFAKALQKTNRAVTLVSVPGGGHYSSMLQEGIPKGIAWLQKLP